MSDARHAEIVALVADALETDAESVDCAGGLDELDGWDSLRRLNVMMAIEETYGVALEPDDLDQMTHVDRIAELVASRSA